MTPLPDPSASDSVRTQPLLLGRNSTSLNLLLVLLTATVSVIRAPLLGRELNSLDLIPPVA